uniref:Uncharacterized protein n=1 Tax=Ditylenchus dipsaci TaxID=166011 RepID=A0A915DPJ2_9BILA
MPHRLVNCGLGKRNKQEDSIDQRVGRLADYTQMQTVSAHFEKDINSLIGTSKTAAEETPGQQGTSSANALTNNSGSPDQCINVEDGNNTDDSQELNLEMVKHHDKKANQQLPPKSNANQDSNCPTNSSQAGNGPEQAIKQNKSRAESHNFPCLEKTMNSTCLSPDAADSAVSQTDQKNIAFDPINHKEQSASKPDMPSSWEHIATGSASNFLVNSVAPNKEGNGNNMPKISTVHEDMYKTRSLVNQKVVNAAANASKAASSKDNVKKENSKAGSCSSESVTDSNLQLLEECFQSTNGNNGLVSSSASQATTSKANNPVYAIAANAHLADLKAPVTTNSSTPITVPNPEFSSLKVDQTDNRVGSSPLVAAPKTNGYHSNNLLSFPQLPYEMTKFFPTSIGGNMNEFEKVISGWGWYTLDGVQLPCVADEILSKFPPNIPHEVAERHVMIFTPNDELVDVDSVEHFYWVVKDIHLNNLAKFYESELNNVGKGNVVLQASIHRLKQLIEAEMVKTKKQVRRLNMANKRSAISNITTVQPPSNHNTATTSASNLV